MGSTSVSGIIHGSHVSSGAALTASAAGVVARADTASITPRRLIQAEVAACITNWRTVTADVELQQKMIDRLSFFMAGSAKGVMREWYEANNPYEIAKSGKLVHVEIKGLPLPVSADSYRVGWVETVRSHTGVVLDANTYEATATVQINPPTPEAVVLCNPGGVYVTSDRRVYYLRFVSKRNGHTPYVGFAYADSIRQKQTWKQQQDAKKKEWETASLDGETVDLSALNFAYEVNGKARWKPERVYDDGRQVFIRLPDNAKSGDRPVLLVRKGQPLELKAGGVIPAALVTGINSELPGQISTQVTQNVYDTAWGR